MKFLNVITVFTLVLVSYSTTLLGTERLIGLYGFLIFGMAMHVMVENFDSYLKRQKNEARIFTRLIIIIVSFVILYASYSILMNGA